MSQANVETSKRGVEAWSRDDFNAWIDLFDPEFDWFALTEVFQGHEGAQQAWPSFKADMQLRARFYDVRDLGDSVLALGELQGIGRTTRLNVSSEIAQLTTFRGEKILSFGDFASHAEALNSVGVVK